MTSTASFNGSDSSKDNAGMRMHIADRRVDTTPREVKVALSHNMRVMLHSRKILTGVTISDTVTAALELYFEELGAARNAAALPLFPAAE